MKKTLSFIVSVVVACAILVQPGLAGPPAGDGWTSLFNGQDLSGWKVPEGDKGHWKVVDGVIDYDAQSEARGDRSLWTETPFGDYVLQIDWRLKETNGLYAMKTILPDGSYKKDADGKDIVTPTPNADSGILPRGYAKAQANIWCWPIGSGEIWGYRNDKSMSAAIRAGCVPKVHADNPVGQWNTFVITVRGDRMTIELNDQLVIDNVELPGLPESGPIGLQHHGGIDKKTGKHGPASSLVQFRNIYLKPLP